MFFFLLLETPIKLTLLTLKLIPQSNAHKSIRGEKKEIELMRMTHIKIHNRKIECKQKAKTGNFYFF